MSEVMIGACNKRYPEYAVQLILDVLSSDTENIDGGILASDCCGDCLLHACIVNQTTKLFGWLAVAALGLGGGFSEHAIILLGGQIGGLILSMYALMTWVRVRVCQKGAVPSLRPLHMSLQLCIS